MENNTPIHWNYSTQIEKETIVYGQKEITITPRQCKGSHVRSSDGNIKWNGLRTTPSVVILSDFAPSKNYISPNLKQCLRWKHLIPTMKLLFRQTHISGKCQEFEKTLGKQFLSECRERVENRLVLPQFDQPFRFKWFVYSHEKCIYFRNYIHI